MPTFDACSSCGKTVYRTKTSRPQITCRECRRGEPVPYGSRKVPPAPRNCEQCGREYRPGWRGRQRRFCSHACAARWGNQQRYPAGSTLKSCQICGEQFRPTRTDKPQRTCSRACGVELRRRDGTLGSPRPPLCPVWIRECAYCRKLFVGRRAKQRTCSADCGRKLNWAETNDKRRVMQRACACGAVIQPHRHKCDRCLKKTKSDRRRRERRRYAVASEPYTLAEIAARDRYRCGFCGKRVAMTKAAPHPKAPTIDHVVPWSISRDDTRANVRLAHFQCNALARTGGDKQLALIG